MTVGDIVTRVRRILDQIPLENESVSTDSQVLGSTSTRFSDSNLMDRINSGVRQIVRRCKASHFPKMIILYEAALADINTDNERILLSRVERNQNLNADPLFCKRRTVSASRRLEKSGRAGSVTAPAYTYEDGQLTIYPSSATNGHDVYVVKTPTTKTSLGDDVEVDERFELALVMYVAASCYQTMQQPNLREYARQVYEDEIQPYLSEVRNSILNDREISVE